MDIVTQNNDLVKAMNRLATALEDNKINRPWMTKQEAHNYIHVANNSFDKLVKNGSIKSHSLHNLGIAVERFNRNELDEFLGAL